MAAKNNERRGNTQTWDVKTTWLYKSGLTTTPNANKPRASKIKVHGPLGKKAVRFILSKVGAKPQIPAVEPDTSDQWLEETVITTDNVIPNASGEPRYHISGYHLYGLALAEDARQALEMGGVPFIQDNFDKIISQNDFVSFP